MRSFRLSAVISIAVASTLSLSCESAQAREIRTFHLANWTGGAFTNDLTGKFSHCSAAAPYLNGALLLFTVTRDYQWNVAFFSPRFNVTPGTHYNIALSVDGRTPTTVPAYSVTDKAVKVDLSPDGQIVSMFRQGSRLTLISNDARYEFNLTNTSKLIPVLAKCVGDIVNSAPIAAQPSNPAPIAAPSSATPAPSIEAANRRAEAVSIVANVLGASGLTGFRILDDTKDQDHNQVAWTADQIAGSLTIADQANIDTLIGVLIGSEAASCSGKFVSGKLPSDQNGERHAFVLCEEPKNSTNTFYLVVPRAQGGNYVFAVTGSQDEASKVDTQLKPVIQRAVFAH